MDKNRIVDLLSRFRWRDCLRGIVLGTLAAVVYLSFDFLYVGFRRALIAGIILGGLIGLTRARRVLKWVVILMLAAILVIAYTPVSRWLPDGHDQHDPLRHCDAVVVLAGGYLNDQVMPGSSLDRVMKAMDVLRQGYADRLLVTQPSASASVFPDLVKDLIRRFGFATPVYPVGPVHRTHDESIAVAALCRQHGWKSVILVTNAWHMQRASELFKKQGLDVVRCPCADGTYDAINLSGPEDRLTAFRYYMREAMIRFAYHLLGWI